MVALGFCNLLNHTRQQALRALLLELQENVPSKFLVAENKQETLCLGTPLDRTQADEAAAGG